MSTNLASSSGDSIELLSTQGSSALANIAIKNTKMVKKEFDKEVKSFVVCIEGSSFHTTNIELPKSTTSTLQIMHRYLVLQCCIGSVFQIEIHIRDKKQIKKRLIFSSSFKTVTKTQLHTQIPISDVVKSGEWMNLCFDLQELTSMSFNDKEEYYCMDRISIGPACTLRKIYSLRQNPVTEALIPKKLAFTHMGDNNVCMIDASSYLTEEEKLALKKKPLAIEKPLNTSKDKPHIAFGRRMAKTSNRPNTTNIDMSESILDQSSFLTEPKPQTALPRMITTPNTTSPTNSKALVMQGAKPITKTAKQNNKSQVQSKLGSSNKQQNHVLLISHSNIPNDSQISRYENREEQDDILEEDTQHYSIEELRILKKPPKEEYHPEHYQASASHDDMIIISEEDIGDELDDSPLYQPPPEAFSKKSIQKSYDNISNLEKSLTSVKLQDSRSTPSKNTLFRGMDNEDEDEEDTNSDLFGKTDFSDEEIEEEEGSNELEEEIANEEFSLQYPPRKSIKTINSYKFKEEKRYNPQLFEDDDIVLLDEDHMEPKRSKHDSFIERNTMLASLTEEDEEYVNKSSSVSQSIPSRVCTVNVGMDEYIEESNSRRMFDGFEEEEDLYEENLVQSFEY
ncbi:hypothetical protein NAEGRDRAFT_80970 [Naegleria gruberi]|uniref:CFA20 domain-containing protein n=1 Tax=Naegleria gruberi TaxID=5762 RepID=D2VRF0_NAEGR|nr:uncharacterized protein NAEGRDRAFT_80970 [Naegleria gruberi]EFC40659.1 hypothetical protein NAEGRDRAFT_80970 [Naegleria gruberi]|eukprot:XP_002673403.1 hypothetical protein NAEGRDRAFT_80970 [Naegleria gruberi strain NEG-M]